VQRGVGYRVLTPRKLWRSGKEAENARLTRRTAFGFSGIKPIISQGDEKQNTPQISVEQENQKDGGKDSIMHSCLLTQATLAGDGKGLQEPTSRSEKISCYSLFLFP
jgi:hypothetical protein